MDVGKCFVSKGGGQNSYYRVVGAARSKFFVRVLCVSLGADYPGVYVGELEEAVFPYLKEVSAEDFNKVYYEVIAVLRGYT
jgi:hypothetical protein